jgi:hypothetical protein
MVRQIRGARRRIHLATPEEITRVVAAVVPVISDEAEFVDHPRLAEP